MPGEVVPFGKYKDQPAEALLADPDYCQWLMAQPWLRDRWPNVYQVIVNYGGEPQDSPEHNQMQARFLDDDWCMRLALLLRPGDEEKFGPRSAATEADKSELLKRYRKAVHLSLVRRRIESRQFEAAGWDVTFQVASAEVVARLVHPEQLPPCTCQCDHTECSAPFDSEASLSGDDAAALCAAGKNCCRHKGHGDRKPGHHWDDDRGWHCNAECYWRKVFGYGYRSEPAEWLAGAASSRGKRWCACGEDNCYSYDGRIYRIECKPDLGDDYPSVLRQVLHYPRPQPSEVCVVVRRAGFLHVTWEQVSKIFAASGVTLIAENAIETASAAVALVQRELGAQVISEMIAEDGPR